MTQTPAYIISNNDYVGGTSTAILGPYDILCGRSKNAYHNIGNKRFRVIISWNFERYISSTTRTEKTAIVLSIVNTLKNDIGGRFLKEQDNQYVEISQKEAREKVGHALRDMVSAQRRTQKRQRRQMTTTMTMTTPAVSTPCQTLSNSSTSAIVSDDETDGESSCSDMSSVAEQSCPEMEDGLFDLADPYCPLDIDVLDNLDVLEESKLLQSVSFQ